MNLLFILCASLASLLLVAFQWLGLLGYSSYAMEANIQAYPISEVPVLLEILRYIGRSFTQTANGNSLIVQHSLIDSQIDVVPLGLDGDAES